MTKSLVEDVFRDFEKFSTIGFGRLLSQAKSLTYRNYPPCNLIQLKDQKYAIHVAVAGFRKPELTVKRDGDYLVVIGQPSATDLGDVKYLHRGLALRAFELKFLVDKYVEIESVKLEDGILAIELQSKLPEEEKARIFEIL